MSIGKVSVLAVGLLVNGFGSVATRGQGAPPPAAPLPSAPGQIALNRQATADAWKAFHSGDYLMAIAKADECIARFRITADQIESNLDTNHVELPTGNVSEADKKRIAPYQILHDVATCLVIKGWSEEKLGRKVRAIESYAAARKYAQARTQDENSGAFWSPAKTASERWVALTKRSAP